jgi:transposase
MIVPAARAYLILEIASMFVARFCEAPGGFPLPFPISLLRRLTMTFLPPRSPDDLSPRYLGLDLAKRESQLAVLQADGQLIASRRFSTSRDNITQLASELTVQDVVAFEVTTNSYPIARVISSSPARIILSNPIKTRSIAEAKIKTDKIDARVLAELARVNYLPEVWMPDPDTEALRHLLCDRRSLVDRRTQLKNTIHSILHRNLISYEFKDLFGKAGRLWLESICSGQTSADCDALDRLRLRALLVEIDRLEASVCDLEGVIAAFITERPQLRSNLDRLLSIPGVNLVVGAGLLAAIGDITRFSCAKRLASYFGLVPSTYQSGDTRARHGRITKKGRSEARWLAVEAAEHLRKAPGPLRALFTRVSKKRGHNVAVVAVARKLAELVWHLLTKQQDYLYEKPHRSMDKRSNVRKLARRKTNRVQESSAAVWEGRPVLYGSGLAGKQVKRQITRLAAEEAEAIYEAVVTKQKCGSASEGITRGFDPTRPTQTDWHGLLGMFAEKVAQVRQAEASKRGVVMSRDE